MKETAMRGLRFEDALTGLRHGARLTREGWNGRGQWVMLVQRPAVNRQFLHGPYTQGQLEVAAIDVRPEPFFVLHNAQGKDVVWLPSLGDLLANDWREYLA